MTRIVFLVLSFVLGCTAVSREQAAPSAGHAVTQSPASGTAAARDVRSPTPVPALRAPGEVVRRTFGAAIDTAVPEVALTDIVANPSRYRDTTVRTRGTVVRVCQRMGCWMEMSADGTPAVRVPMGGHAFFLPRDAQGRPAEVQGLVRMLELSPEARAHLESEGATAVRSELAIDATGVAID